MIRATAATWLNYATTIAFQILFAARFGSSGEAGAFVIAFSVAVSAGGVFVTTATTNVLPRMLGPAGRISGQAIRILGFIGALSVGCALLVAATAPVVASWLAPVVAVDNAVMTTLLVAAAVFLATLAVAGVLGCVALIRGHRFIPALAPALPSTVGAAYLLIDAQPAVTEAFGAVAAGGLVQVAAIAITAVFPRFALDTGAPPRLGRIATLTAAILLLLALLPPLQRALAAVVDPSGAAHFDYAARGIQVALQLLLGGLVITALPEWTVRYSQANSIHPEVTRTAAVAALLLFAAGGVGLVAAEPIVRIVYERGAFGVADTAAVVLLTRILIPGFIAEGLWLVLCQGLLATGRTGLVLRVWTIRFVAQLALTTGLGWTAGAAGVALAYSLSSLITTGAAVVTSARSGILHQGRALLIRSLVAGAITAATAIGLLALGPWVSPLVAGAAVLAIAALAGHLAGLTPTVLSTLRGAPKATEADV